MLIRKAYKYRLKTKPADELLMKQFAGSCRFVWNKALALQKGLLNHKEQRLSYNNLAALLPTWKTSHPFLKDVHSQPIQQTLMNLDRAIKDAFDKTNPKAFPVFKKRFKSTDSFRYPQGFKIEGNRIFLPKIGWVGFFKSRDIEGVPRNVTVSRKGQHWFISIQTEIDLPDPLVHPSKTIVAGDRGIKRFITLSDGSYFEPLDAFRRLERKLGKEQRKLSRKVKKSKNWQKQKNKITSLHIRIADARKDYLHKISHNLSKNHAVVVLEDLKIASMSKSAKGSLEKPGRNVKQKSELNKAILDQGWSELQRQLAYKQAWQGGWLLLINPAYTSQKCSCCGHIHPDNRLSQERFVCQVCGFTINADDNAARNILAAGHTAIACGDAGAVGPLNEAGTALLAA